MPFRFGAEGEAPSACESGRMQVLLLTLGLLVGLFATMFVCLEAGFRLGQGRGSEGLGAIDGAIFGLMGLLVAFTFSGAAQRFDERRHLIVEEANDIGTAYLRLNLLAPADQPPLKARFREYLTARLAAYEALPHEDVARQHLAHSNSIQNEIWTMAVAAAARAPLAQPATMLLLPALNEMFDITTTRTAAVRMHPPAMIFALLVVVFLLCSLLGGYSMAARQHRSWLHIVVFLAILTLTFYTIIDVEFPRRGLIRVDDFDGLLRNVLNSMN